MIYIPTKNADVLLRDIGITQRKAKRVRKTLILHHTLMKHLRASGKVACRFAIKSASKTCSARLLVGTLKMQRKVPKSAYEKADSKRKVTPAIKRKSIGFFFKKDENATCLPGKRDSVNVDGKYIQKYILSDSIRVLYKKYNLENPNAADRRMFYLSHTHRVKSVCAKPTRSLLMSTSTAFTRCSTVFISFKQERDERISRCEDRCIKQRHGHLPSMETGRTPLQRYYHQEDYTCGGDSSEIKIQRRFLGDLGLLHTALRKSTHAI